MELINDYIPSLLTLAIGSLALIGTGALLRRAEGHDSRALLLQLLRWLVSLIVLVALIVALPLTDSVRGQVLSLLGVVITAIIALSSTTFVSNAMAGIMLQATQPFRPGDFIQVNGIFGRVTHRALVHTRVQTETRDFTHLPNLLLVTHPVTVLHREGTIIQAEVSLGYDVHHKQAEEQLLAAALKAGLEDPYVLVLELLDHAVVYRTAGFLAQVKNPLSARSSLRRSILDSLHGADIEITSPSVVAQRQQPGDTRSLPAVAIIETGPDDTPDVAPEQRMFDSAHAAGELEQLRQAILDTRAAIDQQQVLLKKLGKEQRPAEEVTLARLKQKLEWLEARKSAATDAS